MRQNQWKRNDGKHHILHIRIKVIPRASITGVRGKMADDTIKIALKAPPCDGRANAELVKFLACEFGTRPSSVSLVSGASSRKKLVAIDSYSRIPDWYRE